MFFVCFANFNKSCAEKILTLLFHSPIGNHKMLTKKRYYTRVSKKRDNCIGKWGGKDIHCSVQMAELFIDLL